MFLSSQAYVVIETAAILVKIKFNTKILKHLHRYILIAVWKNNKVRQETIYEEKTHKLRCF